MEASERKSKSKPPETSTKRKSIKIEEKVKVVIENGANHSNHEPVSNGNNNNENLPSKPSSRIEYIKYHRPLMKDESEGVQYLRTMLRGTRFANHPFVNTDANLLRFLRARDGDLNESWEMLWKAMVKENLSLNKKKELKT